MKPSFGQGASATASIQFDPRGRERHKEYSPALSGLEGRRLRNHEIDTAFTPRCSSLAPVASSSAPR